MTDLGISAKFYHFAGGQFISFIEVYCLKYSTLKLGRMVNSHLKTSYRLFCVSIFKRGHDRQQKPSLFPRAGITLPLTTFSSLSSVSDAAVFGRGTHDSPLPQPQTVTRQVPWGSKSATFPEQIRFPGSARG